MSFLKTIASRLNALDRGLALAGRRRKARQFLRQRPGPYKLHVGCGTKPFAGWINIDLKARPHVELVWNVTDGLPFPNGSCELIHSEHVLEHIPLVQAVGFLRECHRVLKVGGVVRVGMPCVAEAVRRYHEDTWREATWLKTFGYTHLQTRAEYVNVCFRHWGHQWLYDVEELTRRLEEAGFRTIRPVAWGESEQPELRQRETRQETLLICEATREA